MSANELFNDLLANTVYVPVPIPILFDHASSQERIRALYAYPPSPETPTSPLDPTSSGRPVPLSQRLRTLQTELSALEAELADPTNPLLHKEREEDNVDPGELIRGLVDVRGRLDKIRKGKEGKGRLVGVVLGDDNSDVIGDQEEEEEREKGKATGKEDKEGGKVEVKSIVDMDKRVGQLEKLVGSSNVMLDEVRCRTVHFIICF